MLYLVSGATAAVADLGSYTLLLQIGVWYIAASVTGNILGFLTAFLCNKYFVFKKKESFLQHLGRYFVVDFTGSVVSTILLFLLVEHTGLGEEMSKFVSMGSVAAWNFFLYKFFVYV